MAEAHDSVHLTNLRTRLHIATRTLALQRAMNLTKSLSRPTPRRANRRGLRDRRTLAASVVAEIPASAQLGHDAPQKRPARLNWQQVGGGRDDAKLTVRYRDHAPLVRDAG